MKEDKVFDKLTPEEYTERLGTNYTRFGYFQDVIQNAFTKGDESEAILERRGKESIMNTDDMHVEVEFKGQRLGIDDIEIFVSETGVKKMVIHAAVDVKS